jgi:hypothetical protein
MCNFFLVWLLLTHFLQRENYLKRGEAECLISWLSINVIVELVPTVMIDDLDKSCAKAEPNFNK